MENSLTFLKQMAVRKLVVDLALPEKTIEAVLSHSFSGAMKAFTKGNSVEISGFGKFVTRPKSLESRKEQLLKKIEKYEKELTDPELTETMIRNRKYWIAQCQEDIKLMEVIGWQQ